MPCCSGSRNSRLLLKTNIPTGYVFQRKRDAETWVSFPQCHWMSSSWSRCRGLPTSREGMERFRCCYRVLGSGGFSEVSSLEVEQTAYNHTCLLDHSGEYMTKSTLPSLPKPLTPFFKLYVVAPTPRQYKCCLSVTKCIISNEIASMKLFHYHRNHSNKKKKMALETPLFLYS